MRCAFVSNDVAWTVATMSAMSASTSVYFILQGQGSGGRKETVLAERVRAQAGAGAGAGSRQTRERVPGPYMRARGQAGVRKFA